MFFPSAPLNSALNAPFNLQICKLLPAAFAGIKAAAAYPPSYQAALCWDLRVALIQLLPPLARPSTTFPSASSRSSNGNTIVPFNASPLVHN
uniref:Secreted protein n=1 Tax=Steinernema glaseri TaxID=37863 RepID=A0A1I7YL71_9BILA